MTQRAAVLADPSDPLSQTALSETVTTNGSTAGMVYSAAARTVTATSPAGRVASEVVDAQGHPVTTQTGGLEPVSYQWDSRGRLAGVSQGSGANTRNASLSYYTDRPRAGWLSSMTDVTGRSVMFDYDPAGRVTQETFADGRQVSFLYDASGNLTAIIPPGRGAHLFNYTAVDETESYAPPVVPGGGSATLYTYNRDKQLTRIDRPDGGAVGLQYDGAGRLGTLTFPEGSVSYGYDPATGKLSSLRTADGNQLTYSWDGFLPMSEQTSGAVSGTVSRSYDNNFRVSSLSVNGASTNYGYDADGLLTSAGDMTITRDPKSGLITSTKLGVVTTTRSYTTFGELWSESALVNGQPLLSTTYTRDRLGRITEKIETLQGNVTVTDYGYDSAGRLAEVKENGATIATYGYDQNGNRTYVNGVRVATYDDQDRLLTYDGASYTYTANGELASKTENGGSTYYHYDHFGNLREVKLPDGTVVDYLIDGRDRRIGKRVNGLLVQGFSYGSQANLVAELDGSGNAVARFIYADRGNVPAYIAQAGKVYRIIGDQIGSPRLVVDDVSGEIVQRMGYDAWGKVTFNDNPGAQPFGFAGGIYDETISLVRFGFRDYDPGVGRWLLKDPLVFDGGDLNVYSYVRNNPINRVDPSGLRPLNDCEKGYLGTYIPRVDLDNADLHEGEMPWYTPEGMIGITRGNDIYLKEGVYVPSTPDGMALLGHELVHVGQYREGMTWLDYLLSQPGGYDKDSKYEKPAYDVTRKILADPGAKGGGACMCQP